MVMVSAVDISGWNVKRAKVEKQERFAFAVALTQSAKAARSEVYNSMERVFDRPTPWTKRGLFIIPATKAKPEAFVLFKDQQADVLAIQEVGGVRHPKLGAPILVPVNISLNRYGNISRSRMKKLRKQAGVFTSKQDDPRTRHLPPGIYKRFKRRRRGKQRPPRLLVALEQSASYKARFGMRARVHRAVQAVFPTLYRVALRKALATAR